MSISWTSISTGNIGSASVWYDEAPFKKNPKKYTKKEKTIKEWTKLLELDK